jgi:hypothetical protein
VPGTPDKSEQHEFIRRLEELKQATRKLISQAEKVGEDAERTAARLRKKKAGETNEGQGPA